ncbi:unnamed protein product [Haemonchus placei]|uniref:General transcription factor 3C polypeptide 1 n=1 Tax=Haemonchus placei TaxID=6290 RepID=A0A0N4WUS7_HAEPC|nr:unnamed protein product [Haemonchus placei]
MIGSAPDICGSTRRAKYCTYQCMYALDQNCALTTSLGQDFREVEEDEEGLVIGSARVKTKKSREVSGEPKATSSGSLLLTSSNRKRRKNHVRAIYQHYLAAWNVAFTSKDYTEDVELMFRAVLLNTNLAFKRAREKKENKMRRKKRGKEALERSTTAWDILMSDTLNEDLEVRSDEEELNDSIAEPTSSSTQLQTQLVNVVETKIPKEILKNAASVYLTLDVLIALLYISVVTFGCRWIMLSDILRWMREGRLGISIFQFTALSTRNFDDVKAGPLGWCTKLIVSRLLYHLNLPESMMEQVTLLMELAPPRVDLDENSLRRQGRIEQANDVQEFQCSVVENATCRSFNFMRWYYQLVMRLMFWEGYDPLDVLQTKQVYFLMIRYPRPQFTNGGVIYLKEYDFRSLIFNRRMGLQKTCHGLRMLFASRKSAVDAFEVAKTAMSHTFAKLLHCFSKIIGESEPILYCAFMMLEFQIADRQRFNNLKRSMVDGKVCPLQSTAVNSEGKRSFKTLYISPAEDVSDAGEIEVVRLGVPRLWGSSQIGRFADDVASEEFDYSSESSDDDDFSPSDSSAKEDDEESIQDVSRNSPRESIVERTLPISTQEHPSLCSASTSREVQNRQRYIRAYEFDLIWMLITMRYW